MDERKKKRSNFELFSTAGTGGLKKIVSILSLFSNWRSTFGETSLVSGQKKPGKKSVSGSCYPKIV